MTLTSKQFLQRCSDVHGDTYDYSLVDYKRNRDYQSIICKEHGPFKQTGSAHLAGRGCPVCAKPKINARNLRVTTTFSAFKEKADNRHLGKYQYVDQTFQNMRVKMSITCQQHGNFEQTPESHLTGRGCPACSKTGFDPTRAGFLYVLVCGSITKVGITNLTPQNRAKSVSRSAGKVFEVATAIKFVDGSVADKIETRLLQFLRLNYKNTEESHEGHSECFENVEYNVLQKTILKLCSEYLPTH